MGGSSGRLPESLPVENQGTGTERTSESHLLSAHAPVFLPSLSRSLAPPQDPSVTTGTATIMASGIPVMTASAVTGIPSVVPASALPLLTPHLLVAAYPTMSSVTSATHVPTTMSPTVTSTPATGVQRLTSPATSTLHVSTVGATAPATSTLRVSTVGATVPATSTLRVSTVGATGPVTSTLHVPDEVEPSLANSTLHAHTQTLLPSRTPSQPTAVVPSSAMPASPAAVTTTPVSVAVSPPAVIPGVVPGTRPLTYPPTLANCLPHFMVVTREMARLFRSGWSILSQLPGSLDGTITSS